MKAIRWHAREDVRLDEIPEPRLSRPDELLLRVLFCGVCGTDVEEYRRGPTVVPATRPHPLTGRVAPITLGHEFCGEVLAAGSDVAGFRPGDVVAVEGSMHCGDCFWCLRGELQLCRYLAQYGLSADGGLAELCVVRARTCLLMPPSADPKLGALLEPLSVAVRSVRRSNIVPGGTITVFGGGPIGLLVVEVARAWGASRAVVVEPHPGRRALALRIGASEAMDPSEDLTALFDDLQGGGPDVTFECSGHPGTADRAVRSVRRGGQTVLVAPVPAATLDTSFLIGEKEVVASVSHQLVADFGFGLRLALSHTLVATDTVSEVTDLPGAMARFFTKEPYPPSAGKVLVAPALDGLG